MNKFNLTFLKLTSFLVLLAVISNCEYERQNNLTNYHQLIDKAELAICQEDFPAALENYGLAFRQIKRPFGKDLYNAALSAQASGNLGEREAYLQQLIDGSNEIGFIKKNFLSHGMPIQEWETLENRRKQEYSAELRSEMEAIRDRDQLFRPDYENYDDTINSLRIINLNRILEITEAQGFPAQKEIGFSEYLRTQPHHIVLHHTAQRRSGDKSIPDLEPIIRVAVQNGRLDPELGIEYLKFQNDEEYGRLETYSTWRYSHPLLPDSMNHAIWVPKFSKSELAEINQIRAERYADSIEDIQTKAAFLETTDWPFLFTSVKQSVANLSEDLTPEEAVELYLLFTSDKAMAK